MTKFLEDEIYLDYMNEEAERFLEKAYAALNLGDKEKAFELTTSAKKRFEPSEFHQAHKEDFERIEMQSKES